VLPATPNPRSGGYGKTRIEAARLVRALPQVELVGWSTIMKKHGTVFVGGKVG
jgi:hypothetical protein